MLCTGKQGGGNMCVNVQMCVCPNVWVSQNVKAMYNCLLECGSISTKGFVVAVPRLISIFVCIWLVHIGG